MGYTYQTTNLINGKKYIGLTNRKSFDPNYLGSGKLIRAAIKKYGFNNFKVEVLEYHDSKEDLIESERKFIRMFQANINPNFYNIAEGGKWGDVFSGMSDFQRKEVGAKISKKRILYFEKNPEKRKEYSDRLRKRRLKNPNLSDETKLKISKGLKKRYKENPDLSRIINDKRMETKKKNGTLNNWTKYEHPWIGRNHSEESKKKISESLKGQKRVTPCQLLFNNKVVKEFDTVLDLRMYLKNELKFKKHEWSSVSEVKEVNGYLIKKNGYRIIKPQTTIEKWAVRWENL